MNYIWHDVKIEDILEAQALARERGKKTGESYEIEFLEIMKKKGNSHSGATELTKTELIQEYLSHGKKVASIDVDSQGHETLTVRKHIKKDENLEEKSDFNF